MYLAYFDESGDVGLTSSPTTFFVLSCVLVHQDEWLSSLNRLVELRGLMKTKYAIPTRPELKATDLRRGRGVLARLRWSMSQRMDFYRRIMAYQNKRLVDTQCFSIAIHKAKMKAKGQDPFQCAWQCAFERLDRFGKEKNDKIMVFPDAGHGPKVKRLLRRMRRFHMVSSHFSSSSLSAPSERIIEDPSDRQSHDSYFIQLADWNAYAVHRSKYIDPKPNVPDDLWDELTDLHLTAVNKIAGGPPGIVLRS